MNINAMFPANWLKCADLKGKAVKVTIDRLEEEKMGNDMKWVAYFKGTKKGLVLNKTNAFMIAEHHGGDTANWFGKEIELRPDKTSFKGDIVDCIRVAGAAPVIADDGDGDSDIPF